MTHYSVQEVAWRSLDPERLLPGEEMESSDREDTAHWASVYCELMLAKQTPDADLAEAIRSASQVARAELESVDLVLVRVRLDRFARRFKYWSAHERELGGTPSETPLMPARTRMMAKQGALRPSVLIVDDSAVFRIAIRDLLIAEGFDVAGEAASGEAAISLMQELQPQIALVDFSMPGIGGIEAARRISATLPNTLVVLISSRRRHELPAEAWTSGASAVLEKDELVQPGLLAQLFNGRSPVKATA